MFAEDSHVSAYFAQRSQCMLQQREALQGDSGFVLNHARALAARKNKTGELGVDHRNDFSLRFFKSKKTKRKTRDTRRRKEIPGFLFGLMSLAMRGASTGKLLHGNRLCCFVNGAFAVPGLEDNGMGRFRHGYCCGNLAGGSRSDAYAVNVNPHEGNG